MPLGKSLVGCDDHHRQLGRISFEKTELVARLGLFAEGRPWENGNLGFGCDCLEASLDLGVLALPTARIAHLFVKTRVRGSPPDCRAVAPRIARTLTRIKECPTLAGRVSPMPESGRTRLRGLTNALYKIRNKVVRTAQGKCLFGSPTLTALRLRYLFYPITPGLYAGAMMDGSAFVKKKVVVRCIATTNSCARASRKGHSPSSFGLITGMIYFRRPWTPGGQTVYFSLFFQFGSSATSVWHKESEDSASPRLYAFFMRYALNRRSESAWVGTARPAAKAG